MDATILYQLSRYHAFQDPSPHHKYITRAHEYPSIMPSQSSFVRSSATRPLPNPTPTYVPGYASPLSSSPGSSISSHSMHDSSPLETPLEYPLDSEFDGSAAGATHLLKDEYVDTTHSHSGWPSIEKSMPMDMYTPSFDMSSQPVIATPSVSEVALAHHYVTKPEDYRNSDEYNSPMYFGFSQEASLPPYSQYIQGAPHSVAFGFGQQDYAPKTDDVHYMQQDLQYPSSPEEQPQFVHPAQVSSSPSPGISPAVAYAPLHPTDVIQGCDPRFTVGSPMSSGATSPSQQSMHTDADSGIVSAMPDAEDAKRAPMRRTRRRASYTSSSGADDDYRPEESGESEKEEEDVDAEADVEDDDDEYVEGARMRTRGGRRTRRTMSSSSPAPSIASSGRRSGRVHPPIPIDGLTKKSRGRRVPTISPLTNAGGIVKSSRQYTCDVSGCGKCFARGEHLKRHVRSIHTNEKPHKCPYPGCGKDFSRHDNLGQHMRVHKNYSAPKEGTLAA